MTTVNPYLQNSRLAFSGVVASEWTKLFTLRSTWWAVLAALATSIGVSVLALYGVSSMAAQAAAAPEGSALIARTATLGWRFGLLAVGVLGVLTITGEFGTGMIRSSFAAVPTRLPVVAAKALVLFLSGTIMGLVSAAATWAVSLPILSAQHIATDSGKLPPTVLWSVFGTAAYLGLCAMFALFVGAILRSTAGAVATVVGVFFILPLVMNLLAQLTQAEWAASAASYMLDAAGSGMSGVANGDLQSWQSALVVVAWAAVAGIVAGVTTATRDV
ncbi:ABC transporter permease subunit [Leifsonia xyli]|uniref:ABC transporter permease subunit n=1 Tax=Leifsonia xyli TaxID=1575 RepID=UPI003D663CD5